MYIADDRFASCVSRHYRHHPESTTFYICVFKHTILNQHFLYIGNECFERIEFNMRATVNVQQCISEKRVRYQREKQRDEKNKRRDSIYSYIEYHKRYINYIGIKCCKFN